MTAISVAIDNDQLREANVALTARIQAVEQKNGVLVKANRDLKNKINVLFDAQTAFSAYKQRTQMVQQSLEAVEQEVQTLKVENQRLVASSQGHARAEKERLVTEQDLQHRFMLLSGVHAKCSQRISALESARNSTERDTKLAVRKAQIANTSADAVVLQLGRAKEMLSQARSDNLVKKASLVKYITANSVKARQIIELQDKVTHYELVVHGLKHEKVTLTTENERYSKELSHFMAQGLESEKLRKTLASDLATALTKLQAVEFDLTDKESKFAKMRDKFLLIEQQHGVLQSEHREEQTAHTAVLESHAELLEQRDNLLATKDFIETQLQGFAEFKTLHVSCFHDIEQLMARNRSQSVLLAEYESDKVDIMRNLQQTTTELTVLQAEHVDCGKRILRMESKLDGYVSSASITNKKQSDAALREQQLQSNNRSNQVALVKLKADQGQLESLLRDAIASEKSMKTHLDRTTKRLEIERASHAITKGLNADLKASIRRGSPLASPIAATTTPVSSDTTVEVPSEQHSAQTVDLQTRLVDSMGLVDQLEVELKTMKAAHGTCDSQINHLTNSISALEAISMAHQSCKEHITELKAKVTAFESDEVLLRVQGEKEMAEKLHAGCDDRTRKLGHKLEEQGKLIARLQGLLAQQMEDELLE
jgi:chromosome segregation ATPase